MLVTLFLKIGVTVKSKMPRLLYVFAFLHKLDYTFRINRGGVICLFME